MKFFVAYGLRISRLHFGGVAQITIQMQTFFEGFFMYYRDSNSTTKNNKKAQLSLTNPRDACEKFARFT